MCTAPTWAKQTNWATSPPETPNPPVSTWLQRCITQMGDANGDLPRYVMRNMTLAPITPPLALTHALALAFALACAPAQAQSCAVADANVTRTWVEEDGFRQHANLHLTLAPGGDSQRLASVRARLKFHYQRADGWQGRETTTVRKTIDPQRQRFADVEGTALASLCNREHPCQISHVEVMEVSCD